MKLLRSFFRQGNKSTDAFAVLSQGRVSAGTSAKPTTTRISQGNCSLILPVTYTTVLNIKGQLAAHRKSKKACELQPQLTAPRIEHARAGQALIPPHCLHVVSSHVQNIVIREIQSSRHNHHQNLRARIIEVTKASKQVEYQKAKTLHQCFSFQQSVGLVTTPEACKALWVNCKAWLNHKCTAQSESCCSYCSQKLPAHLCPHGYL